MVTTKILNETKFNFTNINKMSIPKIDLQLNNL